MNEYMNINNRIILLVSLVLSLISGVSYADIQLNPYYGTKAGFTDTNINPMDSYFNIGNTIQQSDGKLISIGFNPTERRGVVFRTNKNGSRDNTFGDNGFIKHRLDGFGYSMIRIIQLSNGKLLMMMVNPLGQDTYLTRYLLDGSLDSDFGDNGLVFVTKNILPPDFVLIEQQDGKIIFNLDSRVGGKNQNDLIRIDTNGLLDENFNLNLSLEDMFSDNTYYYANINQLTSGKLLALVQVGGDVENRTRLVRFNLDGTLDSSFGDSGELIFPLNSLSETNAYFKGEIELSNEKMLMAVEITKEVDSEIQSDIYFVRLNSNGSFDNSYGNNGRLKVDALSAYPGYSFRVNPLEPDGKITVIMFKPSDSFLLRLNSDATLDNTFGDSGLLNINVSTPYNTLLSSFLQSDGSYTVTGKAYFSEFIDGAFEGIAGHYSIKVGHDGSYGYSEELGYSDDAIYTFDVYSNDLASASAIQGNGQLLVAGRASNGNDNDFALARYDLDGFLDQSFGDGGVVTTDIYGEDDQALTVMVQTDGKILLAGYAKYSVSRYFVVVRYLNNGLIDEDFGEEGGGVQIVDFGSPNAQAKSMIQQVDGKIVLVGTTPNGSEGIILARLTSFGEMDNSFGTGGIVFTDTNYNDQGADSIIQQTDGKLVIAGYATDDNDFSRMLVARYDLNGTLDTTFNGSGFNVFSLDSTTSGSAKSLIQQTDGKLVIGGSSGNDFGIARLTSLGALDASFNGSGIQTINTSDSYEFANTVIQQADDKLVLSGGSGDFTALVRVNIDGSLDTSFDNDGIFLVGSPYEVVWNATSMVYQAGTFYLSGTTANDFTISKLIDNLIPTIAIDSQVLVFNDGDAPIKLSLTAKVIGNDDGWDEDELLIGIIDGEEIEDRLFIGNYINNNIHVLGTNLFNDSTIIGSVLPSGADVSYNVPLYIVFNENATNELVEQVLQSVYFENTSSFPTTRIRTIKYTLTDHIYGSSSDIKKVQVIDKNSLPVGSVSITGIPFVSQNLTAVIDISDMDGVGELNYSWKADGVEIWIYPSLTLNAPQAGKQITVTVSYVDGYGFSESLTSEPTDAVIAYNRDDDFDGDGISNSDEYLLGTNLVLADTDGDGIPDGFEVDNGFDPLVDDAGDDFDNNGISNLQEYLNSINTASFQVMRLSNGKVLVLP